MKTTEKIDILSRLCKMGQELSSSTDTDELLARISRCSSEVCDSESASIILLDADNNEMYFKEVSGEMGEIIKTIRIPLNEHSIAGWCITYREPLIINDVSKDPRHYKQVDKEVNFVTRSILAVPITWGTKIFGCVEAVNKRNDDLFTDKDQEYLTILAHQAAVAINNVHLMEKLQNFFSYSVEILISALESLEPLSKGHIIRVARIAVTLARELGFSGKEIEDIWYAAYFHDIGKLARESIYLPMAELDKIHPATGAGLIENIKILENCAPYIRHHHERWDGSGFPNGLKGDEIPIGAQIVGIAEEYDEMWTGAKETSHRQEFNQEFIKHIQGKFSPEIINTFSKVMEVLNSSGRL